MKRTFLPLALTLLLAFLPQATFAVPPKSIECSKTAKDKSPQNNSESRNYESDNYQPNIAGVVETKPLIRIIPQRDGRFLLEPLSPKQKVIR